MLEECTTSYLQKAEGGEANEMEDVGEHKPFHSANRFCRHPTDNLAFSTFLFVDELGWNEDLPDCGQGRFFKRRRVQGEEEAAAEVDEEEDDNW